MTRLQESSKVFPQNANWWGKNEAQLFLPSLSLGLRSSCSCNVSERRLRTLVVSLQTDVQDLDLNEKERSEHVFFKLSTRLVGLQREIFNAKIWRWKLAHPSCEAPTDAAVKSVLEFCSESAMTKAGIDCCKLLLKTTEEDAKKYLKELWALLLLAWMLQFNPNLNNIHGFSCWKRCFCFSPVCL